VAAANGGQTLSTNPDVYAPAGFGGSKWGANGGDITPVAQPKSPLVNMANATRDATITFGRSHTGLVSGLSSGAVSGRTADQTYADDSTALLWTADQESPNVADSQL
jgi:hypothetical protein